MRELQTFGLMDCHDPDGIGIGRRANVALLLVLPLADESLDVVAVE